VRHLFGFIESQGEITLAEYFALIRSVVSKRAEGAAEGSQRWSTERSGVRNPWTVEHSEISAAGAPEGSQGCSTERSRVRNPYT